MRQSRVANLIVGAFDYTNASRASYVFTALPPQRKWVEVIWTSQLHTPNATLHAPDRPWRSLSTREFVVGVLRSFAASLAIVLAVNTNAEDNKVEVQLLAEVKTIASGVDNAPSARFVPARTLSQGEVVYYTVRIRNPTSEYLRDVVVVQPIPANTTYAEQSAAGPGTEIQFSADGGATFAPEARVVAIDTAGAQRSAEPKDFTHIRWRLRNALAPGAVALARFQAVFR